MHNIITILIILIAALHLGFLYLEMVLWTKPIGQKIFSITEDDAINTKALAANQGLYNGFLAAGLVWSLFATDPFVKIFFLVCVSVAGIYGGFSVKKSIFFIQALPALLTLGLILAAPQKDVPKIMSLNEVSQTGAKGTGSQNFENDGSEPAPQGLMIADSTFQTCSFGKVIGLKISIMSFSCGADMSNLRLVANNEKQGFDIHTYKNGKTNHHTVLRVFPIKKDANINTITEVARNASKGAHPSCSLVKAGLSDDKLYQYYRLAPTGIMAKKWEESQTNGGETPPPCGSMGVDFAGERYFFIPPQAPDLVIYVDMGSEIQPYNISTIKPIG